MAAKRANKLTVLARVGGDPTAQDVVFLDDVVDLKKDKKVVDYNEIGKGLLGSKRSQVIEEWTTATVSLVTKIRSVDSTANEKPEIAQLFLMSGLDEEQQTDQDGNVTALLYTPSQNPKTGTIFIYLDGDKDVMEGVACDFRLSLVVGNYAKATFDAKGFITLVPVREPNPDVTEPTSEILWVKCATAVTIGGAEIPLKELELSMNSEIQQDFATKCTKINEITDYAPKITIKQILDKGNISHWQDIKEGVVREIKATLTNGTRTFELVAPACKLIDVNEPNNNGRLDLERTYVLENSAGANFSIIYKEET